MLAFECVACGAVSRPLSGDCCVFCSYGDVPCDSHPLTTSSERTDE
ncbi:MAG TPA: GDCCVxC domain-containing (seleno)protein [Fimbriimonadaceae bacterium]|nr:GDCCVxC domain-containing (seleno)protein [Fimbriimonadaceae bacterium]